ncbi:hypothetical protein BV918_19215 [Pectobacterium odoriferum]|nr:hypothetical protein BCS7_04010 [Pectobacterium odoriferum]POE16023.1 hypothetical protein BV918_19215 [Pectobacterium odoriferum]POE31645.1 hypothetical protein BV922_18745 [Pectobacterium odoriferum]
MLLSRIDVNAPDIEKPWLHHAKDDRRSAMMLSAFSCVGLGELLARQFFGFNFMHFLQLVTSVKPNM